MTANKGQNRVEELENSLSSSYLNRVIHHRLTRGDRAGLFEPLEFIKQLRGLYSYVTVNKHKPSVLVKKLKQIHLKDAQKSFLLYYLDLLFFEDSIRDAIERQIRPYSRTEATLGMQYQVEILLEWGKLQTLTDELYGYDSRHSLMSSVFEDSRDDEIARLGGSASIHSHVRAHFTHRKPRSKEDLIRAVIDLALKKRIREAIEDRYNFDRVRQHLDTLPDNETKIIYLIEIKAEYLQVGATSDPKSKRFDQKCDLEIAKLEKLNELPGLGIMMDLVPTHQADKEKAAVPRQSWSKEEYLIRAEIAAKAIGRRGDKLSDERMADEMRCSRNTATKYRNKYADVYAKEVKAAYEVGLQELTTYRRRSP